MAKVVIFGVLDTAELAHFYLTHDSEHEVVAFTVDAAYRETETFLGLPVVPFEEIERHYPPETHHLFVAMGCRQMNRIRQEKYAAAKAQFRGNLLKPQRINSRGSVDETMKEVKKQGGLNCF